MTINEESKSGFEMGSMWPGLDTCYKNLPSSSKGEELPLGSACCRHRREYSQELE